MEIGSRRAWCDVVDGGLVAGEALRLDMPFVVHVVDRVVGVPSVFGPFEGPVEACAFAWRFVDEVGCDQAAITVTVIALESS
jgi:hypothetical protein